MCDPLARLQRLEQLRTDVSVSTTSARILRARTRRHAQHVTSVPYEANFVVRVTS